MKNSLYNDSSALRALGMTLKELERLTLFPKTVYTGFIKAHF
jgi:hypothetical protein